MTYFYEDDVANSLPGWYAIAEHLKLKIPDSEAIWEAAKFSERVPHLGNIEMELLLNEIKDWCINQGLDCEYFVNALDSHLSINSEAIHDMSDFERLTANLSCAA